MQTNAHALRRKAAFFFTAPRRHRKRRALPAGQRARLSKTNSSNDTHWMWRRFWPRRHTSIKTWMNTWTAAKTMASFTNVTFCLFRDVKNDRTGSSDLSLLHHLISCTHRNLNFEIRSCKFSSSEKLYKKKINDYCRKFLLTLKYILCVFTGSRTIFQFGSFTFLCAVVFLPVCLTTFS